MLGIHCVDLKILKLKKWLLNVKMWQWKIIPRKVLWKFWLATTGFEMASFQSIHYERVFSTEDEEEELSELPPTLVTTRGAEKNGK